MDRVCVDRVPVWRRLWPVAGGRGCCRHVTATATLSSEGHAVRCHQQHLRHRRWSKRRAGQSLSLSLISDSSLPTDTKLRYLGILPLKEKLMFNKAVLVFKTYKNLAPQYLKQLFICSNIRASSRYITLPKPRIDLFKTSFSFSGASLWNTIPNQIQSCSSLTSFKTQLNKWIRSRLL